MGKSSSRGRSIPGSTMGKIPLPSDANSRGRNIPGSAMAKSPLPSDDNMKNHCSSCDRSFKHHRSYVVHMSKHKGKRYECGDCGKSYTSSDGLVVHRRSHSGSRPYTCATCPASFVSKSKCRRHELSHGGEGTSPGRAVQKLFVCTLCKKILGSADTLRIHMGKHRGKRYPCSVCEKSYTSSHSLKVHELKHQDSKQWTCSTCGASFMEKRNLVRHEKSHTGTRNEICDVCGKTFIDRSALGYHRKIHQEREPIQCNVCGKILLTPSSLRTHMKLHGTDRRFRCDVCSRTFTQKHSLQKHQLLHSKDPKQKALFQAPSEFCGKCDKGFTSSTALRRHLKKHKEGSLKQFNGRENRDFTSIVSVANTNGKDEWKQDDDKSNDKVRRDDRVNDLKDAFIVYPVSIFNDNESTTGKSCGFGGLESDQVEVNDNEAASDDDKHASSELKNVDYQPNRRMSNRLKNETENNKDMSSNENFQLNCSLSENEKGHNIKDVSMDETENNKDISSNANFQLNCSLSEKDKSYDIKKVSMDHVSMSVASVVEENISESESRQIDMPPSRLLIEEKSDLVGEPESDTEIIKTVSDKSECKVLECSFVSLKTRGSLKKLDGGIEAQYLVIDSNKSVECRNEGVETNDRHVGKNNKIDHERTFYDGDFDCDDNSQTERHISESLQYTEGLNKEMHACRQKHSINKISRCDRNLSKIGRKAPVQLDGRKLSKRGRKAPVQLDGEGCDMKQNKSISLQTSERIIDAHKHDMTLTSSDRSSMSESNLSHQDENNSELNQAKMTTRKTLRKSLKDSEKSCENKTENSVNVKSDNCETEMQKHDKKTEFVCEQCEKSFTQKCHLNRHKRNNACKDRFKCDLCGCLFNYDYALKTHLKVVHNELPYKCLLCNKRYATVSGLNKHKPSHVDGTSAVQPIRRHICDICGNQYTAANTLLSHMVSHSGLKPFECDICGNAFGQRSHLLRHKSVVHEGVKKFRCQLNGCGKFFSDSRALKVHVRSHTGEKPYKCDFCEKWFSQQQIRNTHQKTHFDKKEFSCSLCKKEFTTKMSLLRHMKIHGKNPVEDNELYGKNLVDKNEIHGKNLVENEMHGKNLVDGNEIHGKNLVDDNEIDEKNPVDDNEIHEKNAMDNNYCVSKADDTMPLGKVTKLKRNPVKKLDQAVKCNYCGKKYFTQSGLLAHSRKKCGKARQMSGELIATKLDKHAVSDNTTYVTVLEQDFDDSAKRTQTMRRGDNDYETITTDVRTSAIFDKSMLKGVDSHHCSLSISGEPANNNVDNSESANKNVDNSESANNNINNIESANNSIDNSTRHVPISGEPANNSVDNCYTARHVPVAGKPVNNDLDNSARHVICSVIEVEVKSQEELPEHWDNEETIDGETLTGMVHDGNRSHIPGNRLDIPDTGGQYTLPENRSNISGNGSGIPDTERQYTLLENVFFKQ